MTRDPVQRLAEHTAARDAWLDAARRQLHEDERVAAVWLVGSLGQGGGDEWSDVDLVVVARDEHLPVLVERCRSELSRFGEVLVAIDAPNAPAGGACLGVAYAIGELPLWVDWYLWPLSTARRPSDARVLIERAELPPPATKPHAALLQHSRAADPHAVVDRFADPVDFAVAMVPIAAKYIARRQPQEASELLGLLDRDAPNALGVREQLSALRRILQWAERERPSPAVQAAAAVLDLTEQLADRW
jgi:predicted nucleotidyltransferase